VREFVLSYRSSSLVEPVTLRKTLRYEVVGKLVVLVHAERAPSDLEWDDYARALGSRIGETTGVLVVTDGAGPNGSQRAKMNELVEKGGGSFPTAVITHSLVARGIVTALSWFNPKLHAFAPTELTAALSHVGADPRQREDLLRRILHMRLELSSEPGHQVTSPQAMDETVALMEALLESRLPKLREKMANRSETAGAKRKLP
jgi:hypothetical protein